MLPRILVAGREDDSLAAMLAPRDADEPFVLEFCNDGDAIAARVDAESPAALVVGLRGRRRAAAVALIRRVKSRYPQLPVVVACLNANTAGRDVLSVARVGAEHFAFRDVDDFRDVLRGLVAPEGPAPDPMDRRVAVPDSVGITLSRSKRRRRPVRRRRFAERTPSSAMVAVPATVPPLLHRVIDVCLSADAPDHVDALALRLGLPRRTLVRETTRRGWPSPRMLLQWGRLFRASMVAIELRAAGTDWEAARKRIATAAGYNSTRAAARAFRSRAGVGLGEVWWDGSAALMPAFLSVIAADASHTRLAS